MNFCVFDHDGGCANMYVGELFGKRCIEADNLLKSEQTRCIHRVVKSNNAMSNEVCLYLFNGKCAHGLCAAHNKSCVRNSGESCGFFMSRDTFKAENKPKVTKPDQTNIISRPSHYTDGRKYEPKDVIRDWNLNFNLGSAVKYISRAGRKDDIIQDLKKAKQFIDFEIEALMEEREKTE